MTTAVRLHQSLKFESRCKLASEKRPKAVSQKTSGFLAHLYCPFYYSLCDQLQRLSRRSFCSSFHLIVDRTR